MKKTIILGFLTTTLFVSGACNREPFEMQKPAVGEMAPALSAADLSGRMLRLADYRNKVVLVNFWAGWCPPCKDEMPGFQKVYLAYEDKDFAIIAVAINEVTPAEVKALGLLFPVVVANDRIKRDYGDIAFPPVSFLIGRDGAIIRKVKGVYSESDLKKDVEQALKG